jgi:tRNA nucleotidyltransferase (CCA-adding enzyme)
MGCPNLKKSLCVRFKLQKENERKRVDLCVDDLIYGKDGKSAKEILETLENEGYQLIEQLSGIMLQDERGNVFIPLVL